MSSYDVSDYDTVQDFFREGGTLQAVMDIAPADLDSVYGYACQLFDSGKYGKAYPYFELLTRLSHWSYDYWIGLGLCYRHLSRHEEAIFCFSRAALLKIDEPKPVYLAGLCFRDLSNHEQARKTFSTALKWCADRPQHAGIKKNILRQLKS